MVKPGLCSSSKVAVRTPQEGAGQMTTRGPCEGRWGPGAARADVRSRGLLSRLATAGLRARLPTAYLARGFLKFLPASLALPPSSSSILEVVLGQVLRSTRCTSLDLGGEKKGHLLTVGIESWECVMAREISRGGSLTLGKRG